MNTEPFDFDDHAMWHLEPSGIIAAFTAGVLATAWDCHASLSRDLLHVPLQAFVHRWFLLLAVACGLTAAFAYAASDPSGQDTLGKALGMLPTRPLPRGLVIGGLVLLLIRSRLFDLGSFGVGGDALYALFRGWAKQSFNDKLTQARDRFLTDNLNAAFATEDYFVRLDNLITSSIQTRPYKNKVMASHQAAARKAPKTMQSKSNAAWRRHYMTMTGICFDACGIEITKGLFQTTSSKPGSAP